METIQAIYDGKAFIPTYPIHLPKNKMVVMTIMQIQPAKKIQQSYLKYAGYLPDKDCAELTAILQETEKVDSHERMIDEMLDRMMEVIREGIK
jgi:hypothetical protein